MAVIGAALDGVVPRRLLLAHGLDARSVRPLVARGVLIKLADGVYRLRDHPWTWRSRLRAALEIAGPGAVVALRSAARLHGCYAYRGVDAVEILVPRGRNRRSTFGRLVETTRLLPEHIAVVDGFPVTTIARTFFDLAGDPDFGMRVRNPEHHRRMLRLYNDALARRGLRFVHELRVLIALEGRGRAGTTVVRDILERCGSDYEPSWSESESLFDEVLASTDFPRPLKQVKVSGEDGFIGVVDYLWEEARLVVEIDSTWHDGPLDVAADELRDLRLVRAGFTVKRYRYRDLVLEPDRVLRELAMILTP